MQTKQLAACLLLALVSILPGGVPPNVARSQPTSLSLSQSSSVTLFSDDFNDGNTDGWATSGLGVWSVENGEYVVDMGTGTNRLGISLTGDASWTDYAFEFDVQGNVGVDKQVYIRYTDANNHYAINLRGSPFNDVAIRKTVAGAFTDIFGAYPNVNNTWYHVKIAVEGVRIIVSVNNTVVIDHTYTGPVPTNGKIAVAGWTGSQGSDKVRYDNVLVTASGSTACVPPPSDLVSWWPGDGNVNDIQGMNHGVLQNGATFVEGIVGQAFTFDGIDDYVDVPDSANLDIATEFTIDTWVMPLESKTHRVITKWGVSGFRSYNLDIDVGGQVVFYTSSDGNNFFYRQTAAGEIPVGQWTHIAAVYKAGTFQTIYVNGVPKDIASGGTEGLPSSLYNSTSPFRLARNFNDPPAQLFFHGALDEVGVYNRALSAQEIQNIFNAGSTGKCKPIIESTISGKVIDGSNVAIPNVTLSDNAGHSTTTGSDGTYTFDGLSAGTYTLTPSKNGYSFSPASSPPITVPPDALVNFIGTSTIDLEVTSIQPLDQPVCAGTSSVLRASIANNGSTASGSFNIRWNADGQLTTQGHNSIPAGSTDTHDYIWSNIAEGQHTLALLADVDDVVPEFNENNNQLTTVFTAIDCSTSFISGRVADTNNDPLFGVTISDGAGHTTTTTQDGTYMLDGIPAGTYTLTPSKSGYAFSPASRAVSVPPDTTGQDFTASLNTTIDYFALGDSIASGHGLNDDSKPCRRSDGAYPYLVKTELEKRYGRVNFFHLACSGATTAAPSQTEFKKDPFKWFKIQVNSMLGQLSNRPTLVSITVGIDDFGWTDPVEMVDVLIIKSDSKFARFVHDKTTQIAANIKLQVDRIPAGSNVSIVITVYNNPVNHTSRFFQLAPRGACNFVIQGRLRCYQRTEVIIHELNRQLATLEQPGRVTVLPQSFHESFHGHESPQDSCGSSPPTSTDTWIQYPGQDNINSDIPPNVREQLGITEPFGDCFHPNHEGANAYARAVDAAARELGR